MQINYGVFALVDSFHCICSFVIYNITEELTVVSNSHLHNILLKLSLSLIKNFAKFHRKMIFLLLLYPLAS
jgi:hypothetical protein